MCIDEEEIYTKLTATHQVLDWNLVDENSCDECMKIHHVWRNCGYGEQPEEKDKKKSVLNHFKLKHEILKRNNILTECYQTCPLPNVPIFFTLLTLRDEEQNIKYYWQFKKQLSGSLYFYKYH